MLKIITIKIKVVPIETQVYCAVFPNEIAFFKRHCRAKFLFFELVETACIQFHNVQLVPVIH